MVLSDFFSFQHAPFSYPTLFMKVVLFLSRQSGYTGLIKEKEVCSMSLIEAKTKK